MKWIDIVDEGTSPSGKTRRFTLKVKDGNIILGRVQWHAAWRKYVFEPAYPTIFEQDCLHDIANYIHNLTMEHKTK